MRRFIVGMAGVALWCTAAPRAEAGPIVNRTQLNAILGPNQIFENFQTLNVPEGGQISGTSPLNSTTTFAGHGPGLVQPGAEYSSGAGNPLFWNGNGYFGLNTRTLGDASAWRGLAQSITYTTPVDAFGFDMQGYAGFPMIGTVSVYDRGNALLGTVPVNGGFVGWENAGGIGRVVVAAALEGYIMIDNHGYGPAIPEPAGAAVLLVAAATGAARSRRMRRAAQQR